MREWITGRNPVYEVLRAGRRKAHRLRFAEGAKGADIVDKILALCSDRGIAIERSDRAKLDALVSRNHQGVALEVSEYPYSTISAIEDRIEQSGQRALLLILDALQDPQNLGTLLRTADLVGVHGVLLPLRRSASVTPAVVKASAGATEHLLVAQANLARTILQLKETGIWIIGLEARSPEALLPGQVDFDIPLALVVGSEGQGMRRLVRDSCDLLLRLPTRGHVTSLNASVAGSVALYLVWQARGFDD